MVLKIKKMKENGFGVVDNKVTTMPGAKHA